MLWSHNSCNLCFSYHFNGFLNRPVIPVTRTITAKYIRSIFKNPPGGRQTLQLFASPESHGTQSSESGTFWVVFTCPWPSKVSVKRELRSSGCCSLMSVIFFYVFCSLTSLYQTICACFFVEYLSYFLRVIPALRNVFFLTLFLTIWKYVRICSILSDIAGIYCTRHILWLSFWQHSLLASILTYFLAYMLTFVLAFYLASILA
jgi:hypothetical protein